MPNAFVKNLRIPESAAVWLLSFIAVGMIGVSLVMDMTGESAADQFVLARWSLNGLRAYLWLEGAVLAGLVTALGVHVVAGGLALARAGQSRLFGIHLAVHQRVRSGIGYVFVVLGAALVALSLTTLVALNACRYMRLI
jgi:hypothetical protein